MKQQITLFIAVCISISVQAQAPKLVGMTSEGGSSTGAGTIMQYTGGATSISQVLVLTSGNPDNVTLIQAPNGKFYGVINDGIASALDAIVEYDYPTHSHTVLANFNSGTGTTPASALLLLGDSTFYGLALNGGANSAGTLFSYTIGSSTITKLVDMPTSAYPYGSLIHASDGNLYGMTYQDGAHGSGTIFSYNLVSMAYTPLYSLPAYAHPLGSLLEVGADTLYGMTSNDSIHSAGSIFRFITSTNNYTVLTYLPHATHTHGSLIRATDGLLYGMTDNGGTYSSGLYSGGTLFSYNISTAIYDTLHNFGAGTDGAYPLGDLYQASDSILYGMTNEGGNDNIGTIFQYNITTQTYARLVSLDTTTGYFPGPGHLTEYQAVPVIHTQPSAMAVCVDSSVTFTVQYSGTNITGQWQVSADSGGSFSNILGATDSSYTFVALAAQNGYLYRLVLTGSLGADTSTAATLTVNSCNVTGITEVLKRQFILYPNPAKGSFTIGFNYPGKYTVQILNLLGERLQEFKMTSSLLQFDISGLAAGIYNVQIRDDNQTLKVLKMVKE